MADNGGLSADDKAAIRDYAAERRERAKRKGPEGAALDLADVLKAYESMPELDKAAGLRFHELALAAVPEFAPKTWYGMPAYSLDGKVLCFFQSGSKYKTRYHTFGFTQDAQLDSGDYWPTSYALNFDGLTPKVEEQITALIKRAAGR